MSLNAKELIDEMKSHKKDWQDHWQKYIPIMKQYVKNHDIKQLRDTISGGNKKIRDSLDGMPIDEMYDRFKKIRTLLAIIIPSLTSMICVTFRANEYNFAYVYFVIDGDDIKPMFFSLGENLISTDGEWRSHLSDIGSYELIIGRHVKHIELIWDTLPVKHDITTHIFYSHGLPENMSIKFHKYLDEQQYGIRLFSLSWFSGKYSMLQTHVASEFTDLLEGKMPDIPKKDADDIFELLSSVCGCRYTNPNIPTSYATVKTGQKLILLTLDEVSHTMDSTYNTWNEIIAGRETTDLILNTISPCFAIHSAWFFIYNADKKLFNLSTAHEKILMSDTIKMTQDDMRVDKVYSDIAVGIINENIGSTFLNDIPTVDIDRYIFDIIFALYCMNTKINKMHGDLHGNNVVMMHQTKSDGFIIYAIGDDEYILRHVGKYACIIDFSRVINIDYVKVIEIAIQKYEIYFSGWVKINYDALMKKATDALSEDMESFAKIATAFDMYEFALSILTRAGDIIVSDLKNLLLKIKDETQSILMSIIEEKKDVEWANYTLIRKLFSPAKERPEIQKIFGYYSHNNELKYSTAQYESLPSSIAVAPMIANDTDTPIPSNSALSMMVKLKYRLLEPEENILRESGL